MDLTTPPPLAGSTTWPSFSDPSFARKGRMLTPLVRALSAGWSSLLNHCGITLLWRSKFGFLDYFSSDLCRWVHAFFLW